METQILREKNLLLTSIIISSGVKIIARVFQKDGDKIYEGELPSLENQENISLFFQSHQEIIDYMKVRENIEINTEMMTIKILNRLYRRRFKFRQIFQINLIPVKTYLKKIISLVIKDCNVEGDLSKQVVKKSLIRIADTLKKLLVQKESEQITFNYSIPSNNILSDFKSFKKEIYNLVYQKNKENQTKNNYDQWCANLRKIQERTTNLEQKFNTQSLKITEQIKQFKERVLYGLDSKVKELTKMYATSQEIQIILEMVKVLGEDIDQLKINPKIDTTFHFSSSMISETNLNELIKNVHHFKCQYLFKETGNRIEYIGQDNKPTHYIFNKKIPEDKQYKFKLKIHKLQASSLYIGILDYNLQKNKRSSLSRSWCYGANGRGYNHNNLRYLGNGFKEGDIVQVIVNRPKENIKWVVNGILQAQYCNLNVKKMLMPFIQLCRTNTSVQWVNDD